MLAALRPKPFRGDQVAAGVVVLTTLVALLNLRFDDHWGAGWHLAYSALAWAFVSAMALQAEPGEPSPKAYQSVLYLNAIALGLIALLRLADVLGSDGGSGTFVWVGAAVCAAGFWFAGARNSAVCTLVGAIAGIVTLMTAVDWLFSPDSPTAFRWVLAVCATALVFSVVGTRDRHRRHAVQLVDAAGLATIALVFTFVGLAVVSVPGSGGVGAGWELFVLAISFGLIAYSSADKEPGPAGFGILTLVGFVLMAATGKATLIGWPLALALMAAFLLVIGLRPTSPAPPEPEPPGRDGDEPVVTTIRRP